MPHKTRAQERAEEIDISPTKLLAEIDELKSELEVANNQAAEYLAGLQRERAEFTNFFNMVSLNAPNAALSSTTFGQITTAREMRQLQLGLRMSF